MQGVPLDGYWVCIDEAHVMNREAMAILLQCATTIFNAVKIAKEQVDINGVEVDKCTDIYITFKSLWAHRRWCWYKRFVLDVNNKDVPFYRAVG